MNYTQRILAAASSGLFPRAALSCIEIEHQGACDCQFSGRCICIPIIRARVGDTVYLIDTDGRTSKECKVS